MLCDVTTPERMDEVSSSGYAWGISAAACLFGLPGAGALPGVAGHFHGRRHGAAFGIVALWWVGCSLPLLRTYRQKYFVPAEGRPFADSFRRLGRTLKGLSGRRDILYFLLAFFSIDGVYTIIDMATAYGTALGLDSTGLLLALLVTQVVAFPSSLAFGRLSANCAPNPSSASASWPIWASPSLPSGWTICSNSGFWRRWWGCFRGRYRPFLPYYTKIIPPEQSGGIFRASYDICGKGAAFMGTMLVAGVSQLTDSTNAGVGRSR